MTKRVLSNLFIFFLILTCLSTVSAETYTSVSLYNHDPISGTANLGIGQDTFGKLYINIFCPLYDSIIRQNNTSGNIYTNILYTSHDNRIRQDGYIEYVYFNCEDTSQLNEYYINIWRKNGSAYSLVYTSENLVPQIKNGSNTLWLNNSTPIREGDFVGESIKGSWTKGYAFYAPPYGRSQYFYARQKLHVSYNRNSATFIPLISAITHPVEIYMKSPSVVFIGDSICAGHPEHYSFLENTPITDLNSSCQYYFGKFSGLSYQNMGIGGQTTSQIRVRFQNDVIDQHPKYAVLEGGVNDIKMGISNETILENWEFMLSECVNNSIQPIMVLILPWTDGSTTQTAQVNYINSQLIILAGEYNATVVDARNELGIYKNETDKWSIKPEYNNDNIHLNAFGYAILGQKIAYAINS